MLERSLDDLRCELKNFLNTSLKALFLKEIINNLDSLEV